MLYTELDMASGAVNIEFRVSKHWDLWGWPKGLDNQGWTELTVSREGAGVLLNYLLHVHVVGQFPEHQFLSHRCDT